MTKVIVKSILTSETSVILSIRRVTLTLTGLPFAFLGLTCFRMNFCSKYKLYYNQASSQIYFLKLVPISWECIGMLLESFFELVWDGVFRMGFIFFNSVVNLNLEHCTIILCSIRYPFRIKYLPQKLISLCVCYTPVPGKNLILDWI